jgi:hypothetical protein
LDRLRPPEKTRRALKSDAVIITANSISFGLLLGILYFKLHEFFGPRRSIRQV